MTTVFSLKGFTADQPLGFLAALGVLRTLERQRPDWEPRLAWKQSGFWRAEISVVGQVSVDGWVDQIQAGLQRSCAEIEHLSQGLDKNLAFTRAELRQEIRARGGTPSGSLLERMVSELPENKDRAPLSLLQMLNGAGHQHYLPALLKIARQTTRSHLQKTLTAPIWRMEDDARGGMTLRLDTFSDSQHALQAQDPNDSEMTSELAANRLAIEALPLFPTLPASRELTCGFHRRRRQLVMRWPVWTLPLRLVEVMGLLGAADMADPIENRDRLRCLGVEAVWESERRVVGKGKTLFSPSRAVPL